MRFLTSTTTIFAAALIIAIGCSSNEAESADTSKQTNQQATDAGKNDPSQMTQPIRNESNPIVTIHTDQGDMVLELYRDVAPAHADSFVALTEKGFYNGLTFHRIVDGFMIQGGDPKGNGTGDAGYKLPAEFSDLPHVEGTLSMARGGDPNSGGCQFFICLARAKFLDGQYSVFGHLLKGYDVLHKIGKLPVKAAPHGEVSAPVETVYMREVYLSDKDGKKLEK